MINFEKISNLLEINNLINKLSELDKEDMNNQVWDLVHIYPFNEYEFVISNLLGRWKMNLEEYDKMRENYHSRNIHLDKFQMAWKSVWKWAEDLLLEGNYWLYKPSRKIDINYSQQTSYDAYMNFQDNIIRVEIKASRVTESWNNDDFFIDKALFSTDNKSFWMNFQQLKPQFCDVFIFIAIYRDKLTYWVLSSDEVKNYGNNTWDRWKFSKWQHSWNSWNEWQLHIRDTNISDFDKYSVEKEDISESIIMAFKKQKNII